MSKASSRYTWTRSSDERGKPVLGSVRTAVGPSSRTSALSSHSPKPPKSKNRVWRPNGQTEKPGRSPAGRRLSTTKPPGASTKGKDRGSYEVSLGPNAIHKRRRAAGLHGNRVWVPNKVVATAVHVEKDPSTVSLPAPQGGDGARQRTLSKPSTGVDIRAGTTSDASTVTRPTARLDSMCTRVPGKVVHHASVGRRKRRHGNLVWRPGQAGDPTVSPGRLCCVDLPSRGAVLRKSRDGALNATKYRWQRRLSAGSQSQSGIVHFRIVTHTHTQATGMLSVVVRRTP